MALRTEMLSYYIAAEDRSKQAFESAKRNVAELRSTYEGMARAIRGVSLVGIASVIVNELKQVPEAAIKTRIEVERMRNTLAQGVGLENVASEVQYLRRTADQYGQSFTQIASAYAKFTAASRGTAIEGQKTRDVFLALTQASTVLGLSAEESGGALTAVQQMISKGKVSAEELRGQLGERLPGAFQIAARAMGVTTSELDKMLQQGELLADDFLPRFAQSLQSEFAGGLDRASQSTSASVNRMSSAWAALREELSTGVVGDAVVAGLDAASRYTRAITDDLHNLRLGIDGLSRFNRAELHAFRMDPGSLGEGRLRRSGGSDRTESEDEILAAEENRRLEANYKHLTDAREALAKLREKYKSPEARLADQISEIRASGAAGKVPGSEISSLIADARARSGVGARAEGDAAAQASARLRAEVDQVHNELDRMTGIYADAQQQLEALRGGNLVGDQQYFEARRAFIRLNVDAEVDALERENAVLAARKVGAKERIDLDKQIADNQVKIERIRAQAASNLTITDTQENSLAVKLAREWEQARASAQAYLDTQTLTQARDLESFGLGQAERERRSGRAQIEDRYSNQRQQLESERRTGAYDQRPEEYERQLELIKEFQRGALDSWDAYYSDLKAKEADGSLGFSQALADYADQARNAFQQVAGVTQTALGGLEEAFAQFATTGKLSFRNLVDSVIADLARLMVRKGVLSLIGMFAGGSIAGHDYFAGRPADGSHASGLSYVPFDGYRAILHRGEAVVPAKFNPAAGGSAGAGGMQFTQHVTINMTRSGRDVASSEQLVRQLREASTNGVADAIRRNRAGLQIT